MAENSVRSLYVFACHCYANKTTPDWNASSRAEWVLLSKRVKIQNVGSSLIKFRKFQAVRYRLSPFRSPRAAVSSPCRLLEFTPHRALMMPWWLDSTEKHAELVTCKIYSIVPSVMKMIINSWISKLAWLLDPPPLPHSVSNLRGWGSLVYSLLVQHEEIQKIQVPNLWKMYNLGTLPGVLVPWLICQKHNILFPPKIKAMFQTSWVFKTLLRYHIMQIRPSVWLKNWLTWL